VAALLLARGAARAPRDPRGKAPIHWAASAGDAEVMRNVMRCVSCNVIHWAAAFSGDAETAALLFRRAHGGCLGAVVRRSQS